MSALKNTPMFENTIYDYTMSPNSSGFNCHNKTPEQLRISLENDNHYNDFRYGKKKSTKKSMKKRHFGLLPNTQGYPNQAALGLPLGITEPADIYATYPDPSIQGARLPIPYSPLDNIRMKGPYNYTGFGQKKSKKSLKKNKKSLKKKIEKIVKNMFGQGHHGHYNGQNITPGTPQWVQQLSQQNYSGQEYANPYLTQAKGNISPQILYIQGPRVIPQEPFGSNFNDPMQFSNNGANTPLIPSINPLIPNFNFSKKSLKNSFGQTTSSMTGPNNVAHETPYPIYHAGGNTMNFSTDSLYLPDMIPGPTNSTGSYASAGTISEPLLKVRPDSITPNSMLSAATDIKVASSGANSANSFIHNGLGLSKFGLKKSIKNRFGPISITPMSVYSPEFVSGTGTGQLTLYQPKPSYLENRDPINESGDVINHANDVSVSFGHVQAKKISKKPLEKIPEKKPEVSKKPEPEKLTTVFKGKSITLHKNGKFVIKEKA